MGDSAGARLWPLLPIWPPPLFLEADSCVCMEIRLLRSGLFLLFLATHAGPASFCWSLSFGRLDLQFSHSELYPVSFDSILLALISSVDLPLLLSA